MELFRERYLEAVERYGSRPAYRDPLEEREYTVAEFDGYVRKLAAKLAAEGYVKGDTVLVALPHTIDFIAVMYACVLSGVTYIPVSDKYPKDRIDMIIEDSGASAVLREDFISGVDEFEPAVDFPVMDPFDTVLMIYTSGSTGKPKGVIHNHISLIKSINRKKIIGDLGDNDVYGSSAPFYFVVHMQDAFGSFFFGVVTVLIPENLRGNPDGLADFIDAQGITVTFISPKVLAWFKKKGTSLRQVNTGSERVSNMYFDNFTLVNSYGMSETASGILMFKVDKRYENTPVGKPVDDIKVYVLDEDGNTADEGELCVAGYLSSGYKNLPELTAKTFVKNPFEAEDGFPTLLHTGDLVKRLPSGDIIYVNRKDWMIKINGQRVEPGEIEAAIKRIPGIKDACVKDFTVSDGKTVISAYYVLSGTEEITEETIKTALGQTLPSYMIPAYFTKLEKLPVNANGKLDRNALQAPDAASRQAEYAAPTNDTEQLICDSIAQLLQLPRIGIDDDFISLGGDSIGGMRLSIMCESIGLDYKTIVQEKTPRKMAAALAERKEIEELPLLPDYPLSQTQLGIYVECMAHPDELLYHIAFRFCFEDGIDAGKLKEALEKAVDNHPALKGRIYTDGEGTPRIKRHDDEPAVIETAETDDIEKYTESFIRPFNLEGGELYRIAVVKCNGSVYLFYDFHHIAADGTSVGIFFQDVDTAYGGGMPESEKLSGFEVAQKEEILRSGAMYERAKNWYGEVFGGVDTESRPIPDINVISESESTDIRELRRDLDISLPELEELGRRTGVSVNVLTTAAFAYLLGMYGCQKEALFTTIYNGRGDADTARTVSMMVKTLPVYTKWEKDTELRSFLKELQDQLLTAMSNDIYSFAEISRDLGIASDVLFAYQGNTEADEGSIGGFSYKRETFDLPETGEDLVFEVAPSAVTDGNGGTDLLNAKIHYKTGLYSVAFIECLAESYGKILREFMTRFTIGEIDAVTERQMHEMDSWNETDVEYDTSETVVSMFRKAAAEHPDNKALIYGDRFLTYAEADRMSDEIAALLLKRGLGRGDVISILIPRGEYMVLASVAALKTGAAYQPLDSTYPTERLNFMVKDSDARLLITTAAQRGKLTEYVGDVLILPDYCPANEMADAAEYRLAELDEEALRKQWNEFVLSPEETDAVLAENRNRGGEPGPDDIFTLLYTSGSTGLPKGVRLKESNLVCFIEWYHRYYGLTAENTVGAYASYGFDANMMDMYTPLTIGAGCLIVSEEMRLDIQSMNEYMEHYGVSHMFMTTQVGRQFAVDMDNSTLRYLSTGGETLVPCDPPESFRFYNVYGPTECTIYTTAYEIHDKLGNVPIGEPLDNVKLYVVDENGHRLPPGAAGELWIAGPHVGAGYLNRPEKTAEVFIENPFTAGYTAETAEKYKDVYRSGDIVRFRTDGNVEFVGRRDGQVKIRGFRIELTEVEGIIREFESVKAATVAAFDKPGGGKFIAAYVVGKEGPDGKPVKIDINALNEFIRANKPPYMVPEATMQIDSIPLNQNGKVNKRALPEPDIESSQAEYVAPRNEAEEMICNAMAEVLHLTQAGIDDDFVLLGGDSIGGMRFAALCKTLGLDYKIIVKERTPRKMAEALAGRVEITELPRLDDYPLSRTQMGIYVECITHPEKLLYHIAFRFGFEEGIDVEKLKAALIAAVDNHPVLKGRIFTDEDGNPRIRRQDEDPAVITVEETDDIEEYSKSFIRPFDLEGGELYRINIATEKGKVWLLCDLHHIIADGTSVGIFFGDVDRAYGGRMPEPEKLSGFEVAQKEEILRSGAAYQKAKDWYLKTFGGLDVESRPLPDVDSLSSSPDAPIINYVSDLDIRMSELEEFSSSNGVSVNVLTMAAFTSLLGLYGCMKEALFTTIYNGRGDADTARTMSMMVKTLPVYAKWEKDTEISGFLKGMQDQLLTAMANDIYSFAEVSSEAGVPADVLFVYQGNTEAGDGSIGGFSYTGEAFDLPGTGEDMVFELEPAGNDEDKVLGIRLHYKSGLYTKEFISDFAASYAKVLREFMMKKTIGDIESVTNQQIEKMEGWNETEVEYDTSETIVSLFHKAAAEYPDNKAVIYGNRYLSYAETERMSDELAALLIKKGIGRGDVVSILIPRGEYMVLGSVAVLKTGAGYQPLDSTYPTERLNFMVKDADARLVMTTAAMRNKLTEYEGEVMLLPDNCPANELAGSDEFRMIEADEAELKKKWNELVLPSEETAAVIKEHREAGGEPVPGDLFTLLYTSGSTGLPKGVRLIESNLVCFVAWYHRYYELSAEDVVGAYASYGFDANMMDMYSTLTRGAALVVVSEDMRLDIQAMNDYLEHHGVTHMFMTTQVGRQFAVDIDNHSFKHLTVGGETLVPCDPPKNFRFHNGYGPTEATVCITVEEVKERLGNVPIGRAMDNVKLYIVDENGHRLPPGAAGELWAAGPHVGAGYLNRPEKTKEVFIDNPFADTYPGYLAEKYKAVYRTGDIVRFRNDGKVEFVGRRDGQVKIRGFRVELSEVEGIIREFEGVKAATVAAFDKPGGGKFIAAYVVGGKDFYGNPVKIDIDALNAFIRANKPPYMVPEATMQIDRIPLNQNGKVNRRALPEPKRTVTEKITPVNEIQKKIFDCVAEAIGHEEFGITTDIFDAGLTSISSIRLNILLGKAFDVVVRSADIKANPTIVQLESFLSAADKLKTHEVQADYPLTPTQEGVFVDCMGNAGTTIYNIPMLYRFSKDMDVEKLKNALEAVVASHPYLKVRLFMDSEGEIRQRRNDDEEYHAEIIEGIDKSKLVRPFRILDDRLFRFSIHKADDGVYLFMDIHHLIADGSSLAVLISDLDRAFRGEKLEQEVYSSFDLALDLEQAGKNETYARDEKFYKDLYEGCGGSTDIPADKEGSEPELAVTTCHFEAIKTEAVKEFCERYGITENVLCLGSFGALLAAYVGSEKSVFTTIYNGRNDSRLTDTVGMLVKTLPVICDTTLPTEKYFKALKEEIMGEMDHDSFPFSKISRSFGITPDTMVTFQGTEFDFNSFCGEEPENIPLELNAAKSPISITMHPKDDGYGCQLEYRSDLYTKETAEAILKNMERAIFDILEGAQPSEISADAASGKPFMTAAQWKEVYTRFNDTLYPQDYIPVTVMLEKQAMEKPDHIAVICEDRSLSYAELNRLANRVAHSLNDKGVCAGKEQIVAIMLNRSEKVYQARQGILKAGGAFLFMDPEYPDERVRFILEDSEAKLLITNEEQREARKELLESMGVQAFTVEELVTAASSEENPGWEHGERELAYCIYTSGSTGRPKGVMIEHGNLSNFVTPNSKNHETNGYVEKGSVSLCLAAMTFDVSIMEEFIALCNGLTAVIATEEEIHDILMLADLVKRTGVDVISTTPSFASVMMDIPEMCEALRQVRVYDLGAEAFTQGLYTRMTAINPDVYIMNGYGPTETTISCTMKVIESEEVITIGVPNANVRCYIVDDMLNEVPYGEIGELLITGKGVGRGYVKLPDKTAAVFVDFRGERAYRSGDLACITPTGEIEFHGRKDNQVKLRGLRVELGEIEEVLHSYPAVNAACCIAVNNMYLVAYYTASGNVSTEELKSYCAEKLTDYMVPNIFVRLDKMPLTSNMKIDRKALPEPDLNSMAAEYAAPRNENEEKLCEIFKKALKCDRVGIDDDFFDLGGTSLIASKVAIMCMNENIQLVYADIFKHHTVRELSELIFGGFEEEKTDDEFAAYSYKAIDEILQRNTPEYLIKRERRFINPKTGKMRSYVGDVLLTGATGFLGIHVLKELLDNYDCCIWCLVRKGSYESPEKRLMNMLMYYFGNPCQDSFGTRIFCIDGDITDADKVAALEDIPFDTLINCAACVKHFVSDDILERINYHGVENLIALCKEAGRRLVQISTVSVSGTGTGGKPEFGRMIRENDLYFGQMITNEYIRTKFLAERAVLEAVAEGLDGKVIRVGNLMSRQSDGEFQINFITNGFLRSLRGFKAVGAFPIGMMNATEEFSPIDETAAAVVKLAGTDRELTVFHACNNHKVFMSDVIYAMKEYGFDIKITSDAGFAEAISNYTTGHEKNEAVSGLLTYMSRDEDKIYMFESNVEFTAAILYRMGYKWPITDDNYMKSAIRVLDELNFFDEEFFGE